MTMGDSPCLTPLAAGNLTRPQNINRNGKQYGNIAAQKIVVI